MSSVRRTVLLVDDDPLLRALLARALADDGYAVLAAENGEEALTLASTLIDQLGLVITDIRMPVMDGVQLAAHLAQLRPTLPILFISGFAGGVDLPGPVLPKPFHPRAFLDRVRQLTGAGLAADQGA